MNDTRAEISESVARRERHHLVYSGMGLGIPTSAIGSARGRQRSVSSIRGKSHTRSRSTASVLTPRIEVWYRRSVIAVSAVSIPIAAAFIAARHGA